MYKIVIVTATRAEYGLLAPLIKKMQNDKSFDVKLVVTGTHLSKKYGATYEEIKEDGVLVDCIIPILQDGDDAIAVSKTMGMALVKFAEYFDEIKPDGLLVLGDRYETLAICCAAMNAQIPIVHLYGGETTEGAIDEAIRHAITKLSYLHMASTEAYKKRIIQLGESPERVFCVGALGVENAKNTKLMSRYELENSLDMKLNKPYGVVTFHPITLEKEDVEKQVKTLLNAICATSDMVFILTKANADAGGQKINSILEKYANDYDNIKLFSSLGSRRYLSAVKYAEFVIGNSSSGLIEVPSLGIPTINIGDRQKGRLKGRSVIDCTTDFDDIVAAIHHVRSDEFRKNIENDENPYGDGMSSDKIIKLIKDNMIDKPVELKKRFYDIG